MKFSLYKSGLFLLLFLCQTVFGQTTNYIINPTSDGGFEGAHGWTIVNSNELNKWYVGSAVKSAGNTGAFVSNSATSQSLTNQQTANSTIYIYKDFVVPTNATSITISFKYKNPGVTSNPPRCLFLRTDAFSSGLPTTSKYSADAAFRSVLNNAANWSPYTNSNPLVTDRTVSFTSNTLVPGVSYRVVFEWSAIDQTSFTQVPPICIKPTTGSLVPSAANFQPNNNYTVRFTPANGQNYGLVWAITGGAVITGGQGTNLMSFYVPANVTVKQNITLNFTCPTPVYTFNGVNSGPLGIDEVSVTYVPTPKITSISTKSGALGSSVTITGENFGISAADNVVYLGGVLCPITSATQTSIVVTIPPHTSLNSFTVLNKTTKLICVSTDKFLPINSILSTASYKSFEYTNNAFEPAVAFATGFPLSIAQKFALADINLDNKVDVVSYAVDGTPRILKNTATSGEVSSTTFAAVNNYSGTKPTYATNSSKNLVVADLNNDGKLDLASSNAINDGGFVTPNTSVVAGSPSLGSFVSLLPSSGKYKVDASFLPIDINLDGRLDLFGLNGSAAPNTAYYSKNNSTNNSYSFDTGNTTKTDSYSQLLNFSNAYGGETGDIDGDGRMDVVYGSEAMIIVAENRTTKGNPDGKTFSFNQSLYVPTAGGKVYSIKLADFDGDGKLDVAGTNSTTGVVSIARNLSTPGTISLLARQDLIIPGFANTASIAVADMNGDGKPDIITGEYTFNVNSKIAYLQNTSTSGVISFAPAVTIISGSSTYQQIEIVDIDGDNKPDILAANTSNSTLDVFRNRIFESGEISADQIICAGTTATTITSIADATVNTGTVQYQWQKSTSSATSGYTDITGETNATLSPGSVNVKTYFRRGSASSNSPNTIYYTLPSTVNVNAIPTVISGTSNTICGAGSVPISAKASSSLIKWYDASTGGNYIGQSNSNQTFNTPSIFSSTTFYAEALDANGCISVARTAVQANLNLSIPVVTVGSYTSAKCDAGSFVLSASTTPDGTIKWYDSSHQLVGTGDTFITPILTASTDYFATASNCNGESNESTVHVDIVASPTILDATDVTVCYGTPSVTLNATSSAGSLNWYTTATGGSASISNATVSNIIASLTRYVSASISSGGLTCESARTPVIITSIALPTITATTPGTACGLVTSSVGATPSAGASIKWYSELAGINLVGTGNTFTTPLSQQNQTYYAQAVDAYGCTSASLAAVSVTNSGATVGSIPNVFALTNETNRTISATGLSGQSSYIWQRSTNDGATWSDLTTSLDGAIYSGVSGTTASSANLTLSSVGEGLHLYKYRLKLNKASCTSTYSNDITLKVADIYGECAAATTTITAYTSSTAKTGINTPGSVAHTNSLGNISDGNNESGIIVQSNSTVASNAYALSFDGSNDKVSIPNSASHQLSNNFTIEAWVKVDPSVNISTSYMGIATKVIWAGSGLGYGLDIDGGKPRIFSGQGWSNWSGVSSPNDIASNTWVHLAGTYDGSNFKIYVNGILQNTQSSSTGVSSNTQPFTIGSWPTENKFFKGLIDDVRIWNLTRTAAEILQFKDVELNGNETGLISYYNFNQTSGSSLPDLTSGGLNGDLTGFALSGSSSNWVSSSPITAGTAAIITADLGATQSVNGIRITDFSSMSSAVPSFNTGTIELSNDNISWIKVLANISGTSAPAGNLFSFPAQNARYVRLVRKDNTATNFYGISELAIYNQGYESVPYIRLAPPSTKYTLTGTRFNQSIEVSPIVGETISSYQWSSSTSLNSNSYTNLADISTTQIGTQTSTLTINPYSNSTPTYYKLKATQSNGCTINAQTLSYLETVPYYPVVANVSSLQGLASWTVNANGTAASTPPGFNFGKYFILQNSANNVYSLGNTWTNNGTLKLNGNKLTLGTFDATIGTIEEATSSAYIITNSTGYLKSTVEPVAKLFPVGTSASYAPVTITNNTGTDDVFSVKVADGSSQVTNFINKTWTISKTNAISGGRFVDLTFEWSNADIQGTLTDPVLYYYNGSSYVVASGTTITKTSNSLTLTGYTGPLSGTSFRIYNSAPTITSFSPTSAGTGVDVVITGTGLLGATAVSFGATAATTFTVNSATKITARVAAGTAGSVSIITPGGIAILSGFTFINSPTISHFTPAKTNQGTTVTITGTGFTGATSVSFGGVPAHSYTVVSSTQITAVIKAGSVSGDVSVTTNGGTATKSGFVFGLPYTSIDRIAGWAASNTSTQAATYSATYTSSSVLSSARQFISGLVAVSSTDSKWTNPNTSASLVTASAPYVKLLVATVGATKFDRIVIPGLTVSGTTKLQLRWSVDNYTSSLGEFGAASGNNYALSSVSLLSTSTQPSGDIEFRIYAYNGNGDQITFKNGNSYTTLDGTPSNYSNSSDAISIFGVTKPTPTLGTIAAITANLDDAVQMVSAPSSPSSGAFTYSLSSNSVASISGSVLSYVGIGTATLTAVQAATEDYASATTSTSVTIKTVPSVLFNGFNKVIGDSPVALTASSNSAGAFSYSSSNTAVGTISGTNVVISGSGITVLSATQAAHGNYINAIEKAVLIVKDPTLLTPTLSWVSATTKTMGMPAFSLNAPISSSAGAFTYYSSDESVATIAGDVVTILRPGTSTIIAVQAADAGFNPAQISMQLVVNSSNRVNPVLSGLASHTKIITDNAFNITAPTSTWNGGTIVYKIANPDIATISGNTITIKGVGNTKIIAVQEGSGIYNAAYIESTLTVNLPPVPVISYTSPAAALTKGTAIAAMSPVSSGGAVVSYSIYPNLPAGLTLNSSTGVISGTPSMIAERQTFTVSATNLGGTATSTVVLTVNDVAPAGLIYSTPNVFLVGSTINTLTPTISGGPAVSYSVSPNLPGGLILDANTGEINGLPSALSGTGTYTITASNSGGSTSNAVQITVNDIAPTSLAYITPNVISKGNPITPMLPSSTGGVITNYSVTPALPAGLTLDANTGIISGTAVTVNTTMNTYTITASNVTGQVTAQVEFLVNDSAPNQVVYTSPNIFTKGTLITPITFTNTGGVPDEFFVDGDNLPAGLTLNTATGVITGTPTSLSPATDYIIYAQNFTGTYSTTVNIAVIDVAPSSLSYSNPPAFIIGTPITSLSPSVSGGPIVSYSVSPALPAGLSLNSATGVISGTPTSAVAASVYTITATNSGGSTSYAISVTVNKRPNPIGELLINAKVFGDTPFELTAPSSGSTGSINYSSNNAAVATVSGTTVTVVGPGVAIITATIANDATYLESSVYSQLIVAKATPVIGAMASINKTYGDATFTLTAPQSNSNGAITYSSSNASVATISGTTVTIVGAGTATITASQAATVNYNSGVVSTSLVVAKATPVIGAMSSINKTYGDVAFTLTAPQSNSNGAITFTSSNASVASINGSTVTIVGSGVATITASQAATSNYLAGTVSTTITVTKSTPTLGTLSAITKTFGDAAFTLITPSTNSNGSITFSSSNTSVASVNGNTVTIIGAGTATITATLAEGTNYVGRSVEVSITVAKANPTLGNMASITKTFGEPVFDIQDPTTNSTGAITYTSSNVAVATVSGNTVTIIGAGAATITASQAATVNYNSGTVSTSLVVAKATPVIGAMASINKTYGDAAFTLTAPQSNSNGAITYSSSNASVATISGTTVTIVGAGTATITASQAATVNYNSGVVSTSIVVAKSTPVIGAMASINKTYGDVAFTLTAPQSNSNGAITFTSSNASVASINGSTVTIVGSGVATITASQAATSNYLAGTVSTTITVTKSTPTLGTLSAITKTFGDAAFTLITPSTNSNGSITFSSSNTSVASVNGNTVTIIGAGTATITATLAEGTNYVGRSVEASITVAKANPTLGNMASITKTFGEPVFDIQDPTTNSTGAITYTSSNEAVATVSGNTVTIIGAGAATITASQAATVNYNSGTVSTSLVVAKATPVIGAMASINKTYGDAAFTLTAPQSNSNGAITYSSSNASVATISGTTVTIVGAGTATITASQAATVNYNSGVVSTSIVVAKATPVIGAMASINKTYGDAAFILTAPQSNSNGAITYTSSNMAVATISGNKVTIVGAGTSIITASLASDSKYLAKSITTTLTVSKATPILSGFFTNISKASSDPSFVINNPISSGGTGGIMLVSSNIAVISIVGNTAIVKGPGVAVITATQSADANYNEASISGTISVLVGDSDGDGVPDSQEIIDGTDPFDARSVKDTDRDGVPDYIEIIQGTSPWDPNDFLDTDGDGIPDYVELMNGTDPNNPGNNIDSDGDGVPDAIEKLQGTDPRVKGQFKDTDGDGVPDYIEFLDKTNPKDGSIYIDEDNDGIPTYVEGKIADTDGDRILNYADLDSDNDGVSDRIEAGKILTKPADTDGDGIPDYLDLDSDNDTISDETESDLNYGGLPDCDQDGIINRLDPDICMNYSPQGISPNGDGENDYLAIPSLLNYPTCSISIYDRSGNLVFYDEVYRNLWGGKNNKGEELPDGTYYYVLDFRGERANISTFVYLSRLSK